MNRVRLAAVVCGAAVSVTCSGTQTTPTTVPPVANASTVASVTSVMVGALGGSQAALSPGQTRQLFAIAEDALGVKVDVTNLATWASTDASIATVSTAGLVTAVGEGTTPITATYSSAKGTLAAEVVLPCAGSLSPPSLTFSAMASVYCSDDNGSYGQPVTVTASKSSCNWTVASDVPWLGMNCYYRTPTYSSPRPGSGSFQYAPLPNNTPTLRTGHLTVTFSDGSKLVHTVRVEPPACSYVVSPSEVEVTSAGGSGWFDLTVTPEACQWTAQKSSFSVNISTAGGTGSQRVYWEVLSTNNTHVTTHTVTVRGLSGTQPPGTLTVRQSPRGF